MKPSYLAVAVALTAATSAHAHDPYERPQQQLDVGMGAATSVSVSQWSVYSPPNDLSCVAWVNSADGGVYVSYSDGRGRTWGAPVRIDKDLTGSNKELQHDSTWIVHNDSVFPVTHTVYVMWRDDRNDNGATAGVVENDLFVAYSKDGGLNWTERRVPKIYPAGTGRIEQWALHVDGTSHGDHLWVPFTVDPTGSSNDELYYAASHNNGLSFTFPVQISAQTPGAANVSEIAMASDYVNVFVAFVDDRSGTPKVYFQKSPDEGFTWQPSDKDLGSTLAVDGSDDQVKLAFAGNTVAATWLEEAAPGVHDLHLAVSQNLGTTFSAPIKIGDYVSGTHDVDNPSISLDHTTAPIGVFVGWEDDRNGIDDVYVGSSLDAGASFTEEAMLSSFGGGAHPQMMDRRNCEDEVLCVFGYGLDGAQSTDISERVFGTATWHPKYLLSYDNGNSPTDNRSAGYDPVYRNAIVAWTDASVGATDHVMVGGMRQCYLNANGFIGPGKKWVNFSGGRFTGASCDGSTTAQMGVFLSLADSPGLAIGDGRTIDLTYDYYMALSLNFQIRLPTINWYNAPLGPSTSAQTNPFKWGIPQGTTFYIAALVYDIQGSNLVFYDLTDASPVTVQ